MEPSCQGCRQRDRAIAELQTKVAELQKRLDEMQRAAKRQAAPFSKGKPKEKPKKPGRKKGEEHGKHGHREPPPPDQVDETHEASLPDQCPDCGGQIVEDVSKENTQPSGAFGERNTITGGLIACRAFTRLFPLVSCQRRRS